MPGHALAGQSSGTKIGCGTGARRLGAYDEVFTVGLVPYGSDLNTFVGEQLEGPQLSLCLVRESVSYSKCEFIDCFHC